MVMLVCYRFFFCYNLYIIFIYVLKVVYIYIYAKDDRKKNLYLIELIPIGMNFIGTKEEVFFFFFLL
jgi:hypothetical protein